MPLSEFEKIELSAMLKLADFFNEVNNDYLHECISFCLKHLTSNINKLKSKEHNHTFITTLETIQKYLQSSNIITNFKKRTFDFVIRFTDNLELEISAEIEQFLTQSFIKKLIVKYENNIPYQEILKSIFDILFETLNEKYHEQSLLILHATNRLEIQQAQCFDFIIQYNDELNSYIKSYQDFMIDYLETCSIISFCEQLLYNLEPDKSRDYHHKKTNQDLSLFKGNNLDLTQLLDFSQKMSHENVYTKTGILEFERLLKLSLDGQGLNRIDKTQFLELQKLLTNLKKVLSDVFERVRIQWENS